MANHKIGASGVRGVFKSPYPQRPWGAKIRVNGKDRFLGHFVTVEEASEAIDKVNGERLTSDVARVAMRLLEIDNQEAYARLVASANERIAAAKALGVKPFDLPEGWDLA